ncbi:MAG: HNH endonuclease [Bacillota bacterium]|nr:HNH endonuclease [Bacillota bacterium]
MNKRKPIGQKKRFEVFKRDSFMCQYCGRSAPEIVLEVDHIKPVSKGGTNDILNLITSCKDCNRGKGAKELSDTSTITKQKDQLDELNERRIQLEMLAKWRESLQDLQTDKVEALVRYFDNYTGYSINDRGKATMRRWVKKYSMDELYNAIDISTSQYLEADNETGDHTLESVEKAFDYIERIAAMRRKSEDKPYLRKLLYIRGILRNRLYYVNETEVLSMLENAHLTGIDLDDIQDLALTVSNWTEFSNRIRDLVDGDVDG